MHGIAEHSGHLTDADATAVHGSGGTEDRLCGIDLVCAGPQRHEDVFRCIGKGATARGASNLASK